MMKHPWINLIVILLMIAIFVVLSFWFRLNPAELITAGKMLVFEESTFLEERGDSWGGPIAMIVPFIISFILLQIGVRTTWTNIRND